MIKTIEELKKLIDEKVDFWAEVEKLKQILKKDHTSDD